MKVFYRPDGSAARFPLGRSEALQTRSKKYETDACEHCADYQELTLEGKLRYTKTDRCALCASMDSYDFYGLVTRQADFDPVGRVSPSSRGGARFLSPASVDELAWALDRLFPDMPVCSREVPPVTPSEAAARGEELYVRPEPCNTCGSVGLRHVLHGCLACHERKGAVSPRQKAIAAGESWYTPDKPCKRCGTTAPRSVHNGQCKGCKPATSAPSGSDGRETPSSRLMRECPDLVLSKEDARGFGFTVYRTGKACRNGHRGYRYVSTGGCVECLRGR